MHHNQSIYPEKFDIESLNYDKDDSLIQIGLRLRGVRESQNLSRERLAELSFCNESTIKRIENGSIEVKYSLLKYIAKALHVNVTYLMGLDYHEYPYIKEIIECYQKCSRFVLFIYRNNRASLQG